MAKDPFLDREYTWVDDLNSTLERTGYKDPEFSPVVYYAAASESAPPDVNAAPTPAGSEATANPPSPGNQAGGTNPWPDLPKGYQWVNDPAKLSSFLFDYNKKYPLNPSDAPKEVKSVYDNMKAPESNYGPPSGDAQNASRYWFKYMGFNDQYADNKGSVESKGRPDAWVPGSQAAGLNQVRPVAAEDVGFIFGKREGDKLQGEDLTVFRKAMEHPGFNSLVGAMVARKYHNLAKGDPFKTEAGYRNGFGKLREIEREGKPWPNPGYIREMFPGQWDGKSR